MSAFLVSPEHIGAMIGFGAEPEPWRNDGPLTLYRPSDDTTIHLASDEGRELAARVLAHENLRSLRYRYPDTTGAADWGPWESDMDYLLRCNAEARRFLGSREKFRHMGVKQKAANIWQMCNCYEYQSCEAPEWKDSDARAFVDRIAHRAARVGMGDLLESAPWEYVEPRPELRAV